MKSAIEHTARGVALAPGGLLVGGVRVPLLAGSVHYWRLDPRDWRACLEATRALGLRLVDVYVPWAAHERGPGVFEFGAAEPSCDLASFLRIAHELGLYVILRPGPHINAELTNFGIPERVIWDPACQARSASGAPVMLPMLPFAFPVPSYASHAFANEVDIYFQALGPVVRPLLYPEGPVVLVQIDNEGALYFRDGAYDQDYHPDAVELYRAFAREKYGTDAELERAYTALGPSSIEGGVRIDTLAPPVRFDAKDPAGLVRHVDWAEFHEHLLATAFDRFARSLEAAGIDGLPTSHNLPMGQDATPLNAARVGSSVDLVGLDYYNTADPVSRSIIARRTSELAVRSEARGHVAFAAEMGAGFPPFFPPLHERDSAFTVLTALAYGLRGFNVYMAVERDRWIGAPIDPHGRARPFADFWRKLTLAIEATRFVELTRKTPVRIVVPRLERRIARVMHAFGPLTGAVFSVIGGGAREAARESELGLGYPIGIEADVFARACETALEARGVPFAVIGGEDRDVSLDGARWIVCATSGAMKPELFERLAEAAKAGACVTLGPRPAVAASVGELGSGNARFDLDRLGGKTSVPRVVRADPAVLDAAVARAIDELDLPVWATDPASVFATVHEDALGHARVMFLLNPSDDDVIARVSAPFGVSSAVDVLDDSRFEARHDGFDVRMRPRTARMLALS